MKRTLKLITLFIVMAFLVSMFVACSSGEESSRDNKTDNKQEEQNVDNENGDEEGEAKEEEVEIGPAKIIWAHQWGEEHFWENYGDLLKEKFPQVEIEVINAGTDHTETLEEAMAAGQIPDIISMSMLTHTNFLINMELAYDHDEIIEKTGFDLTRLEPSIVEYSRRQDPDGEGKLYIIPNSRPTWVMHYNKDVFDILGVDYPTDGMTWEEVVELAKQLTREVNGVQYYGLDLDVPYDAWTQFSVSAMDPDTDEVVIATSEEYRRFFQMLKDVLSIPGYPQDEPGSVLMNWGSKFPEGNWAMSPRGTHFGWLKDTENNWDIVTYPVWEGYEGINPQPNAGGFAITAPSENKEVAMKLIEYLLSDEVQMEKSKKGEPSILVNPEVHAVFGQDVPEFQGKNVEALFKYEYATGPEKRPKYNIIPWAEFQEFANSGMDVNEYLRVYQEEIEEWIRQREATE